MAFNENRPFALESVFVGVCLLAGLISGGYFIGKGLSKFKSDTRTVTVKGLVEKRVKADQATWELEFKRTGDDLKDVHVRIVADRQAVLAFLSKHGFKDEEIARQPTLTTDKLASEYGQNKNTNQFRYVVNSSLIVTTKNIDLVTKAQGATEELLESGVILDYQSGYNSSNPRYVMTTFNALRPQLLAEATNNARSTAQQFASDSGSKVGRIRSANQGVIQIFGTDGNDESGAYSPTSTPMKKIRVVSTFEFELE